VVPEPLGGAHRDWDATAARIQEALREQLAILRSRAPDALVSERYEKFRRMGVVDESAGPSPR
jgi:acetyl-CoA carboxylase carboxyl transferase subunit alpha